MNTSPLIALIATLAFFTSSSAQDAPATVSTDTIINLPLKDTWTLFTTPQGVDSMGYTGAQIELRMGGDWKADAGDGRGSLAAEIASFEPERMLSLKHAGGWSVLYFQAMGQDMTGIRWVELAPRTEAQRLQALADAHRALFNELVRRYAPECDVCKKEKNR